VEKLIANLASSKVRSETLKGKDYYVAPVSMILEGVWPGSSGPILYPEAEIAKSIPAWNHKPITVEHPKDAQGNLVSGALTESLEKFSLGIVLNAKYNKKTKKLQAEAWFEKDRFDKVEGGARIEAALLANQKLEVSTGLFVDALVGNGTYGTKNYVATASNFRPDHLAIILKGEGACSLKDGAGLLVNKATPAKPQRPQRKPKLVGNAKNLYEIVEKVEEAIKAAYEVYRADAPSTFVDVEAVYDDYAIVEVSTGVEEGYFQQNYAIENGSVTLLGELIPVTKKVTYQVQNQKQEKMERQDLIKKLGSEHAEFVTNMSDEAFKAIEKALAVPAQVVAQPEPAKAEKIVCNSVEALLEHASEGVKNQVNDALAVAVKQRESLIEKIVANAKDGFTKEELASFPTSHLNKLASMIQPAQVQSTGASTVYAGEAFVGNQNTTPSKESVPVPPSTFAKSK